MKKIIPTTQAIFFVIMSLFLAHSAMAAAGEPIQTLRRTQDKLNSLLKQKTTAGSPQEKKVKEDLKKIINSFLDYDELAKQALGKHWADRSEKERNDFTSILRDIIERNYIKQLRTNLAYKLEYGEEKINGESATVQTTIKFTKNNRENAISIGYEMRKVGKRWMVFDVITDEVSLVKNYRSQFNRIIKRESFEALLKKMKQKLKEEAA